MELISKLPALQVSKASSYFQADFTAVALHSGFVRHLTTMLTMFSFREIVLPPVTESVGPSLDARHAGG